VNKVLKQYVKVTDTRLKPHKSATLTADRLSSDGDGSGDN